MARTTVRFGSWLMVQGSGFWFMVPGSGSWFRIHGSTMFGWFAGAGTLNQNHEPGTINHEPYGAPEAYATRDGTQVNETSISPYDPKSIRT